VSSGIQMPTSEQPAHFGLSPSDAARGDLHDATRCLLRRLDEDFVDRDRHTSSRSGEVDLTVIAREAVVAQEEQGAVLGALGQGRSVSYVGRCF